MQPHVFTWLLHAAESAEVQADGKAARIEADGVQAEITANAPAGAWERYAAPVPARISQYLGNVLHHPGERKAPQRWVLRLASARSTTARFEVTMRFRKASAVSGAAPDTWALFRDAPGALRHEGLSTDGSVFAGRGLEHWIAIAARSVRQGAQPLFTASAPINVAWNRSSAGIDLDLRLDARAAITVHVPGPGGQVKSLSLPKGEHRVRIRTAF